MSVEMPAGAIGPEICWEDGLVDGMEVTVLVVGASATGLFAAAELARHGVGAVVVDPALEPDTFSQAVGLQAGTLEVLRHHGLDQELIARGRKLDRVDITHSGALLETVPLAGLPSPYPFMLVCPQAELEALLLRQLQKLSIPVLRGISLVALRQQPGVMHVEVELRAGVRPITIRARHVMACDGALSVTRRLAGLTFPGDDLPRVSCLADLGLEGVPPESPGTDEPVSMRVDFADGGVLSLTPLPQAGRFRLVMEMPGHAEAEPDEAEPSHEPMPLPSAANLQTILRDRLHAPAIRLVGEPAGMCLPAYSRHAEAMRQGHIFLTGEAAHIHSPLGGLGLNIGILDVFNLCWKLALVEKGHAWPHLLDSYHHECHPVMPLAIRQMNELAAGIAIPGLPTGLRNTLAHFLGTFQAIRERVAMSMTRLGTDYRNSPAVDEQQESWMEAVFSYGSGGVGLNAWREFHYAFHAGDRIPAFPWPGGGILLDLLADGLHHALVFTGPDPSPEVLERAAQLARAIQLRGPGVGRVRVHLILGPGAGAIAAGLAEGLDQVRDVDGLLAHDLGNPKDGVYILRPDGYLGFRCQPAIFDPVQDWLATIFSM